MKNNSLSLTDLCLPSSRKEYLETLSIPPLPVGNESKIYKVDDTFTASATAPYRGDFIIVEIYRENGFMRYMALPVNTPKRKKVAPLAFRQKDIAGSDYVAKCHEAGKELFREFGGDLLKGLKGKKK